MAATAPSRDYKTVGAQALAMAPLLLPEWIGGMRKGREWVGETRANGGLGNSWSVNLETGVWAHFGSNEAGSDLISLYAALHHIDQGPACKEVAELVGLGNGAAHIKTLPLKPTPERGPEPIPMDAPPVPPHYKYGAPTVTYTYGSAFVVCRYDLPQGKQFTQHTWREGRWQARAHPGPRPLFGAEFLKKRPAAPVLIVEGEKCALAARPVLLTYIALSWSGGAQAVKKTDWSALKDRDVLIWPDADQAGADAARAIAQTLHEAARRVRVITPSDHTDGWDIADAIAAGWDAKAITAWAQEHVRTVFPRAQSEPPPSEPDDPGSEPPRGLEVVPQELPGPEESGSCVVSWAICALRCNQSDQPYATSANVSLIVQRLPDFKNKIWYDVFRGKMYTSLGAGAEREYEDEDDLVITHFIQHTLGLEKFNSKLVAEGVRHASYVNRRNSLTDWLDGLIWDQSPRLDTWLADCLGVERNEYSDAIARNWPIAMVARAYSPGCQMDNMIILEGKMGLRKSSFLKNLGGPWYKALSSDFGSKAFLESIIGAWIIEIPDMTGFNRADHSRVLATVTIRSDEWRRSYGRHSKSHLRTCVFAATSETSDYIEERRGMRRYWPILCKEISLDALASQREQVFAEAIVRYNSGDHWYDMPDRATDEQLDRAGDVDAWTGPVLDYMDTIWNERVKLEVNAAQILERSDLKVEPSKHNTELCRRVSRILKANGWIAKHTKYGDVWKKVERREPT